MTEVTLNRLETSTKRAWRKQLLCHHTNCSCAHFLPLLSGYNSCTWWKTIQGKKRQTWQPVCAAPSWSYVTKNQVLGQSNLLTFVLQLLGDSVTQINYPLHTSLLFIPGPAFHSPVVFTNLDSLSIFSAKLYFILQTLLNSNGKDEKTNNQQNFCPLFAS